MKKFYFVLFTLVTGFSTNIKSTQEEEIRELLRRQKVIEHQLNKFKNKPEVGLYYIQKKDIQEQLEAIKKNWDLISWARFVIDFEKNYKKKN